MTIYGHNVIAHRISDDHVGRKLPAGYVPLWIVVLFNKAVGLKVQRLLKSSYDPTNGSGENRQPPPHTATRRNMKIGARNPALLTLRTREGEYHEGLRWTDSQR